jgi:hypothetical protein
MTGTANHFKLIAAIIPRVSKIYLARLFFILRSFIFMLINGRLLIIRKLSKKIIAYNSHLLIKAN